MIFDCDKRRRLRMERLRWEAMNWHRVFVVYARITDGEHSGKCAILQTVEVKREYWFSDVLYVRIPKE